MALSTPSSSFSFQLSAGDLPLAEIILLYPFFVPRLQPTRASLFIDLVLLLSIESKNFAIDATSSQQELLPDLKYL